MKCSFTSRKCLNSTNDVRCESEEIRELHSVELCLNMHQHMKSCNRRFYLVACIFLFRHQTEMNGQLQACSALTSVPTDQTTEWSTEPVSTCWRRKELQRLSVNEFPSSDSWKVALLTFLEWRRVGSNGTTIPASIF